MKGAYESFPLGLWFSHRALLRNLDRFVEIADGARGAAPEPLGEFVELYGTFLEVHHLCEDEFIFPALRRRSGGRSSDAAHLDRWSSEHREIYATGRALGETAARLRRATGENLGDLRRISMDLKALLEPHVASEEASLTGAHLREMIPERELESAQRSIGKKVGSRGAKLGAFLAHSLAPDEQRRMFGELPWIVRKLLFGFVGERSIARFRPLVIEPSLAV